MTESIDHEKIIAMPDDWYVICPDCGDRNTAELSEQDDGGFEPDVSESFIQCGCGKLIEIVGRWRNLP